MTLKETINSIANKKRTFYTKDIKKDHPKNVSRQAIAQVLKEMVLEGKLIKTGTGKQIEYAIPKNAKYLQFYFRKILTNNSKLEEYEVLNKIFKDKSFESCLKENIKIIFEYSFTEILNNAIEHSKSKSIIFTVEIENHNLIFSIKDFGIGVYNNVMKKFALQNEYDAINELLKGKTTTTPRSHSGEGIFFTLKIADKFILESYGFKLTVDNIIEDIFVEEVLKRAIKGTNVKFYLSVDSNKHLINIFRAFQTDPEEHSFNKTEIMVKLYTYGTIYISRSQARRLLANLQKFKKIILDFKGVPTIGQAFADEIFRVFKSNNTEIIIEPINTNDSVQFMIDRVVAV